MEGTTQRSGQLIETELLPDPDPLWQIVEAGSYSMLFQNQGDGRLAGWEMFCGGPERTFELSPSVPDLNWKLRGSGYFNHHYPYLIWQNELTGQIGAWKMGGYGTIRRRDRLDGQLLTPSEVPDTNWRIVGISDFNSDGHSDLLWQHQTSGLIAVWYMNGLTMIEGGGVLLSEQVPDTDWKIRAVGDVNGDFHDDLIWQHQTTGLVGTWLMKGHQLMEALLLSPDRVDDTNWRIVGTGYRNPYECWY